MPIIEVKDLTKVFKTADEEFTALSDISLSIEEGEIFGVIGLSGAGKSTFVRTINLLEKPTSGSVKVRGKKLTELTDRELREERRNIGMIFQHFNLLMQRNVLDNVAFPLEITGIRKKDARKKAAEYLEVVGLSDKAKVYPSQLSGGQKQRVAIARSLAGSPKIILSDEATSALDPETTSNILALLKKINKEYGITIVLITHEMKVIEQICDRVAVLDAGHLVETGTVEEVFSNPETKAAKRLIYTRKLDLEIESEDGRVIDFNGRRAI